MSLIKFITNTLGMGIKPLKVSPDSFGSVLLSNTGIHGLEYGLAAILSVTNLPVVILPGMVQKKPVVRNGKVAIRDILPASATFDHRVCDGGMGGRLAKTVQKYTSDPKILVTS